MRCMSSARVTSQQMARAVSPLSLMRDAVSLMVPEEYFSNLVPSVRSTSVREETTTLAPWAASPRQMALPMPRLPPVTTATFPSNLMVAPAARVWRIIDQTDGIVNSPPLPVNAALRPVSVDGLRGPLLYSHPSVEHN